MSTQQFSDADRLGCEGVGGEFDAVMRKHYRIMNDELLHKSGNFRDRQDVIDAARLEIANAYETDRAADKQRIAELEELLVEWETRLSSVMPEDFKDWHQNSKKEWPAVAAWMIENQRKHIDDFWSPRVSELEAQIADAQRAAPKGTEPDPALIDSMAMRYRHDFGLLLEGSDEKEVTRRVMRQIWEEVVGLGFYRPTPTPPETSGDLIAGDGD